MAVKYHCPKCSRCFVDWGAQKLEFKCPTAGCDQTELVLLDSDGVLMKAALNAKRSNKNKSIVPIANPEDRVLEQDIPFNDSTDAVLEDGSDNDPDDDEDDDEPLTLEKE